MTNKDKIKLIQQALNDNYDWHEYYPLVVDGIFGPKTCRALYGFQQEFLSDTGVGIKAATFAALYLEDSEELARLFGNSCASWYSKIEEPAPVIKETGGGKGSSTVSDPIEQPIVPTSEFPVGSTLLGGLAGVLVGLAANKSKKVPLSKPLTLAISSVLGSVSGFLYGKMK